MDFLEFRKSILKTNDKRHHSIKNSIGVRDAFKWCQKHKWFGIKPLTEKLYYKIIRTINTMIALLLLSGQDVKLPQRMGQIELRKYNTYVKFDDGKIKTNRGVDWDATLKLWYEDSEAKENKIIVKMEDPEVFILYYNKVMSNFNNKSLYDFKPNRELLLAVKKAGKEGKIDAYKIGL